MQKQIGLWIDHKKAVIVTIENKKESIQQIESHLDKHTKSTGGSRGRTAYSPQYVSMETQEDRRYHEQLNKYYRQVISAVRGADALFVFGAGEAKFELEKKISGAKKKIPNIQVEAADKMTPRQIAAKVRKHFQK